MANYKRVFVALSIVVLVILVLVTQKMNSLHNVNYLSYIFTSNVGPAYAHERQLPLNRPNATASKTSNLLSHPKNATFNSAKNAALNYPKNATFNSAKNEALNYSKNATFNSAKNTSWNPPKAAVLNPPENPALTPVKPITSNTSKALSSVPRAVPHDKKYLIYRCSGGIGVSFCSGLGNRQIGIVASYLLANATDRIFGVIMNHPCKFDKFIIPNRYNWIITPKEIKNLTSTNLSVRNNRGFTNSLAAMDFNKKYPQDVVYILNNQEYHLQLLQNKLYRKNLKWARRLPKYLIYWTVLNRLFKLHPDVQKKKDIFFQMARPLPKSRLMCAQVRMGKNPSIPWDNRQLNTMKGVQNLWNFFDQRDNISKVFVTSDSLGVVRDAKKRFGTRFITTEGPIMHIDKPYRVSVCAGMEKTILDQMILLDCNTLVVSSSSFGLISSYWRNKPDRFMFRGGRVVK